MTWLTWLVVIVGVVLIIRTILSWARRESRPDEHETHWRDP